MTQQEQEKKYYLRIRQTEKEYLVSICDEALLGKTVSDGDIELYVNEQFFGGNLSSIERCLQEIIKATNCNLIGEDIVKAAIEERLCSEYAVMWINCKKHGRVGHVMIIR
jgi:hypothetical protein